MSRVFFFQFYGVGELVILYKKKNLAKFGYMSIKSEINVFGNLVYFGNIFQTMVYNLNLTNLGFSSSKYGNFVPFN
jgi:hypothetical protein